MEEKTALIEKIKEYNREIERLNAEIKEIEEKEERLREKTITEYTWRFAYWELPVRALNTVFYTERDNIKTEHSMNMSKTSFGAAYDNLNKTQTTFHMAAVCEDILEESKGVTLLLADPYRRIKTTVLNMTYEEAQRLKGYIVSVKFKQTKEAYEQNLLNVVGIKKTKWTLTGRSNIVNEIKDPVAKIASEFHAVRSEEEAEKALVMIQNYLRATDGRCTVGRVSNKEIRIMRASERTGKSVLYSIFYENGELWFASEPNHENSTQSISCDDEFLLQFFGGSDKFSNWKFKFKDEQTPEIKGL